MSTAAADTHVAEPGRGPGQWWTTELVGSYALALRCPACRRPMRLTDASVTPAGAVGPLVACAVAPCGWAAPVRLAAWAPVPRVRRLG